MLSIAFAQGAVFAIGVSLRDSGGLWNLAVSSPREACMSPMSYLRWARPQENFYDFNSWLHLPPKGTQWMGKPSTGPKLVAYINPNPTFPSPSRANPTTIDLSAMQRSRLLRRQNTIHGRPQGRTLHRARRYQPQRHGHRRQGLWAGDVPPEWIVFYLPYGGKEAVQVLGVYDDAVLHGGVSTCTSFLVVVLVVSLISGGCVGGLGEAPEGL